MSEKKYSGNFFFDRSLEDNNPNWHEGWCLYLLVILTRFCQLIFYQNFPNFLQVKIDINRVFFDTLPSLFILLKVVPQWRLRWV